MLTANTTFLNWKDDGSKGIGGGKLAVHTSWLMFDGSILGTLRPGDVKLIDSADYAVKLCPASAG